MRFRYSLGAVFTLVLLGCAQLKFLKPPSVPRPLGSTSLERGPAFGPEPIGGIDTVNDWGTYNRTLEGNRGSPLADIDTANVARLVPVCTFDLGEKANFQTGPVVIGGTMYLTTAERTYAIDAASCALRWKHTYKYRPHPDFDLKVNRGVAYAGGRLYRGSNDGRLYALDARTGKTLWNVVAGDVTRGETFPAAPIAWSDLVFIGNAGGDNFGVTGRMMAFDARTGGRVWSFGLTPQAGEASRTWPPGTEVIPQGGGATWTSYALDTLAGSIFLATGNAAPDFLDQARPGSNLHTYSVVELDAHLGTLKSAIQLLKSDNHDWDLAAAPSLITTARGQRLIVRGDFIAFDARTGAIRWHYPTGRPIGGGVVTYRAAGKQLIAVASGMHSPVTWKLKSSPAKVVVFGLP